MDSPLVVDTPGPYTEDSRGGVPWELQVEKSDIAGQQDELPHVGADAEECKSRGQVWRQELYEVVSGQ